MSRSLPARAIDLFMWRFSWFYGRWLCWRHLDGVWGRGLERTRALAAEGPIILACNHSAWWDAILLLLIHHWLGVRGRFIVAREGAEGRAYVASLGGIAIDRDSLPAMAAALEEAATFLQQPRRSVLLFPQGRFRSPHARPLGLHRGVALLQRLTQAPIVPVVLTYPFLDHHLPACVMSFGEPIPAGRRDVMDVLEARMAGLLDEHDAWLDAAERPDWFSPVLTSGAVPYDRSPLALVFRWGAALASRLATLSRSALGVRRT